MMRNRFDRQLTELNQDMIQMGHMIGTGNRHGNQRTE